MSHRRRTLRNALLFAVAGVMAGALFALDPEVASAQSITVTSSAPLVTWSFPLCVDSTTELAWSIADCMDKVMHPRGIAGGEAAEVDVNSAALLCRRSRSADNSDALQSCVRSLMYERSGLGSRREFISGADAAIACRYATNEPYAELIEDCMLRMLYTRSGLGHERTDVSPTTAAYACQSVIAPPPLFPWPYTPLCAPPQGAEASRFLEDCMRRLMFSRDGLGARRPEMTASAAALACQGAISWYP
ncbi:MAG: hypothetical protein IRZ16_19000 [Myxococcaceae bacterium]|nr:hypothetical protein [Myxococcaceae bacterium]